MRHDDTATLTEPDARQDDTPTEVLRSEAPTQALPLAAPSVIGRGLHLDGSRGPVLRPVDLTLRPGALTLVTGPAGSGRTSLALALTGRLDLGRGSDLEVLGHRLPRERRAVQKIAAVVNVEDLDALDEHVSVRATVQERLNWAAPAWRIVRKPTDGRIEDMCARAFGSRPAPHGSTQVHELSALDNFLLRVSLALVPDPDLLVVDDIDALADLADRTVAYRRLRALADEGLTVVVLAASADEPDRVPGGADQHVELSA